MSNSADHNRSESMISDTERPDFSRDNIDAHYDRLPWVLGAFGRLFGLKFAPINIPLSRRLQTFAVFYWMSTFLFMGIGSLLLLIYIFFYTKYWWFSLCYFTFYIGDRNICENGGRRFQWMREWRLWNHFADFFPAKLIKTCDYDPNKNYIFGYHPHGVLTAGAAVHFATEGTGFSKKFPGLTPHLLTLGGHFIFPLYRDFVMSFGALSATRTSMDNVLRNEKGAALCLVVGGAPESLDCHPGEATIHLSQRKGFCKMALRHGASLVPVYSFGENEIYEQVANPQGSFVRKFQDWLRKLIGVAPVMFIGRGVFQYSFGIVPFRKPITTIFGKPIDVVKVENPTSEQICDLHARYVKAITYLYNNNKDKYSEYPSTELKIV